MNFLSFREFEENFAELDCKFQSSFVLLTLRPSLWVFMQTKLLETLKYPDMCSSSSIIDLFSNQTLIPVDMSTTGFFNAFR